MKITDKGLDLRFEPESESDIFELGQIASKVGGGIGCLDQPDRHFYFEKRRILKFLMGESE